MWGEYGLYSQIGAIKGKYDGGEDGGNIDI